MKNELTAFVTILPAWINDRDDQMSNFVNVSLEKAKELAKKYIDDRVDWQHSFRGFTEKMNSAKHIHLPK